MRVGSLLDAMSRWTSIDDRQAQFACEGNLGPLVPAIILRLRLAELPIQFFLQLVVELNAEDLPTVASISPAAF